MDSQRLEPVDRDTSQSDGFATHRRCQPSKARSAERWLAWMRLCGVHRGDQYGVCAPPSCSIQFLPVVHRQAQEICAGTRPQPMPNAVATVIS